jgi:hypothetical protein
MRQFLCFEELDALSRGLEDICIWSLEVLNGGQVSIWNVFHTKKSSIFSSFF